MAVRRILQLGDPALRAISQPIPPFEAGDVLTDLADTLIDFRQTHGFGRAISAVQIGSAVRVILIDFEQFHYELIDPVIVWVAAEKIRMWDDCFSFPNLMVHLKRHIALGLKYRDREGKSHELEAEGALAELIQHEMDHLDGVLAVDHALDRDSFCTREEWTRRHRAAS